jgi:HlyD family secretion protein
MTVGKTLLGVLFGVLIASGVGIAVGHFRSSASLPTTVKPRLMETSVIENVAALGRLEPQGEVIYLSAPAAIEGARVEKLLVKLGETVERGQIIAILDNYQRLKSALTLAQKQVKVAQTHLAQVKAGAKTGKIQAQTAAIRSLQAELEGQIASQTATIKRLQYELQNAKTECDRYQSLYKNGAISASQRDNICLQEDTLREQLQEAQATRSRTVNTLDQQLAAAISTRTEIAEVRPTDVAVVQAEVEAAEAGIKQAEANLDLALVRSPRNGQILKIYTFAGERIGDKGIVALGNTSQMNVVAEVYETDIHKVAIGQQVRIQSQGFLQELTGEVIEIGLQIGKKDVLGTDPASDSDVRVVEVRISLDPVSSQKVKALTNLQVNVIIYLSK